MEYEARATLASAYQFIRQTHELTIELTTSMAALIAVMAQSDPTFTQRYADAFEAEQQSERAVGHAQMLGVIDSVIATLQSGQMGNA